MRAAVYQHIVSHDPLTDLIPAERWYSGRAVVDTPVPPFAALRFMGTTPGISVVKRARLEIWVHDKVGSYDLIDEIILGIRARLDGVTNIVFEDSRLIQSDWVSDSGDLFDPAYGTNTKNTGFDLVGKGL